MSKKNLFLAKYGDDQHLNKALNDSSKEVVKAAKKHPNYKEYFDIKESLDSPLETTTVPKDSFLHQMGDMSAKMVGGSNFKMHKMAKGLGYLIQFDKEGATELHHVDEDMQGGYVKKDKPSMLFISTVTRKMKDLLDSGKKVRIVAHHNLSDKFEKISNRLMARHPEYASSDPIDTTHEITMDKLRSWEISKR